eukprot:7362040-Alexandrium_andersonii.AAC.4
MAPLMLPGDVVLHPAEGCPPAEVGIAPCASWRVPFPSPPDAGLVSRCPEPWVPRQQRPRGTPMSVGRGPRSVSCRSYPSHCPRPRCGRPQRARGWPTGALQRCGVQGPAIWSTCRAWPAGLLVGQSRGRRPAPDGPPHPARGTSQYLPTARPRWPPTTEGRPKLSIAPRGPRGQPGRRHFHSPKSRLHRLAPRSYELAPAWQGAWR